MIPLKNRLKTDRDFSLLFKRGRFVSRRGLTLKFRAGNRLPVSRFGFVVSTKVSKSAVERNRIRRRLRAVVSALLPRIVPGFDAAFLVGKELLAADKDQLASHVTGLLKDARMLASSDAQGRS